MSNTHPSQTEAFLAFAHGQLAAGGAECSPEELLARWRSTRQTGADSEETSALEILQKAGFIGCIETGVDDLSTNELHMEGFGQS
jgi:hypothetical protein